MSILTILNTISSTPGTNDKLAILAQNKENSTLKQVCELAYNPKIKYWIKKRPVAITATGISTLNESLDLLLQEISTRKITGNAAITFVVDLLNDLSINDQEVLLRIIERDLKCGIGSKQINKTWKGLIADYPVLLCSKYNEKTAKNIRYPQILQCKMDSSRINLEFDNGKFISATTRNGNVLSITCFDEITVSSNTHFILDGELMWRQADGKISERKISNGYITKAVRGTITDEEASGLFVSLWDYIPYDDFIKEKCIIPYEKRFEKVNEIILDNCDKLTIVESEIVNSTEEVMLKYNRNLDRGEEGCILKAMDGIWKSARSMAQLKLKAELTADLEIIGFDYGKVGTQFEHILGSVLCKTSCGKLQVSVGSGFSVEQRANPEQYIGKIIEVKYNAIISSRNSEIKSLFLPVFSFIREDKIEANSLKEIEC